MASGFMSWHGPRVTRIYEEFLKRPEHHMRVHEVAGDQAFIRTWKPSVQYFQDLYPRQVVSYKVHCMGRPEITLPTNSRVLCFHGKPKPHEIKNGLQVYWKQ